MSFSSDVKAELSEHISKGRHCQIAEIAAILCLCGRVRETGFGRYYVKIQTENAAVARKFFLLTRKAFHMNCEVSVRQGIKQGKQKIYVVMATKKEEAEKLLQAVKWSEKKEAVPKDRLVDPLVIQQTCCKRAFIRGAFLVAGSVSDPEKFYHCEIALPSVAKAEQMQSMIGVFDIEAKIVQRKKYYVVYIKEGSMIVDILNVMEAHIALMNLENLRILKEMRNDVNRKVNCETANINKTVSAAVRQRKDIQYIEEKAGLHMLSEGLEEVARLRLENPEISLKELGQMLSPPVGKSGVNHRLRKISNYAEELRG